MGKEIVPANATVARQLALTRGEHVVRIRRVRLADGVPLSFDETYLPLEIGKKIITNNLNGGGDLSRTIQGIDNTQRIDSRNCYNG